MLWWSVQYTVCVPDSVSAMLHPLRACLCTINTLRKALLCDRCMSRQRDTRVNTHMQTVFTRQHDVWLLFSKCKVPQPNDCFCSSCAEGEDGEDGEDGWFNSIKGAE